MYSLFLAAVFVEIRGKDYTLHLISEMGDGLTNVVDTIPNRFFIQQLYFVA
jgi:hypothetical protein